MFRKLGYKITRYESLPYDRHVLEINQVISELSLILEKNSIKGVFVECGFGYGRSFAVMSHFASMLNRRMYGFDSFSGVPEVLDVDHSLRLPKQGEWSVRTLKEANRFVNSLALFRSDNGFKLEKFNFAKMLRIQYLTKK